GVDGVLHRQDLGAGRRGAPHHPDRWRRTLRSSSAHRTRGTGRTGSGTVTCRVRGDRGGKAGGVGAVATGFAAAVVGRGGGVLHRGPDAAGVGSVPGGAVAHTGPVNRL